MTTPALIIVRASVQPGHDEKFHNWMEQVHIPDVERLLGCKKARRYEVMSSFAGTELNPSATADSSHRYIAVYEYDDASAVQRAMAGPDIARLRESFNEDVGAFATREANVYRQIYPR